MKLTSSGLKRWQKYGFIGAVLYLSVFLVFLIGYYLNVPALTHPDAYLFIWMPYYLGAPMTYVPQFIYENGYESIPFVLAIICMLLLGSFQCFLWGVLWSACRTFDPYRYYKAGSGK